MTHTKKIVLLMCGSFNPLTIMHLRMFETARDHFSRNHRMEVMEGIISPTSNHYELKKDLVPWQHRCEMIRLALKPLHGSKHWVQLSDWECSQNSWTRTIEVLKHHQQLYDDRFGKDNVAVKFLCGADLFESFNKDVWLDKDIETITRDFGVVVITRQGNDPWQTLTQSRRSAILTKHKDNIHIVEEKIKNNISSTVIRQCIAADLSIRYLVDDDVIEYIKKHQLYALK